MKKITIRYAKVLCLFALTVATLAGLIVCAISPDYSFPGDEYKDITKAFFIIVFSIAFGGCLLVTIVFTTREVKLVKRLNEFSKTLGDDALFFRGRLIIPGSQQSPISVFGIIAVVLFGVFGVFFWAVIRACKGVPTSDRIFLLYNDGLYAFELINTNSIFCKRGSIKSDYICATDTDNVKMSFKNEKLSYEGKTITIHLNTAKTTTATEEVIRQLKDLFPQD